MPTDASGAATAHVAIPTYATSADAPSGLGFNSAMAALDALLSGTQALGTLGWGPTSGGATIDIRLSRPSAGILNISGVLQTQGSLNVARDDTSRIYFGSLSDTSLYRSGVGTLKTDGNLTAAGGFSSLAGNITLYNAAGNQNRAMLNKDFTGADQPALALYDSTGTEKARFYVGTGTSPGLLLGGDTNLYRSAAGVMKTDGQFIANDGGIVTKVGAAAAGDPLFTLPIDGLLYVDSLNNRLWVRYGAAWHYVTLT